PGARGPGFARTRSARCQRGEVADGGQAAAGKAAHASHTAATGRAQHRSQGRSPGVAARTRLHARRFAGQGLTQVTPSSLVPVGAQHAAPFVAITNNSRASRRTPSRAPALHRLPAIAFPRVTRASSSV